MQRVSERSWWSMKTSSAKRNGRWEYVRDPRGRRIGLWSTGRFVYITDLFHPIIQEACEKRHRELGLSPHQSLPPIERVRLDLELLERYGGDDRVPAEVHSRLKEWLYARERAKRAKK